VPLVTTANLWQSGVVVRAFMSSKTVDPSSAAHWRKYPSAVRDNG
jgi:GTP-dependent phosphoenolpyruvate carboxykinase